MFRAKSAHYQVNDADCIYMQPLVSSLSASDSLVQPLRQIPALAVAQDGHMQRVTIPEAAYVQSASLTS